MHDHEGAYGNHRGWPGTVIHEEDVMFARPATEFSSNDLDNIIGRKLLVDLEYGQLIPRTGLE